MFPLSNPEMQLQLHNERAAELRRAAEQYRRARAARRGGRGRHAAEAHPQRAVRAPVTP